MQYRHYQRGESVSRIQGSQLRISSSLFISRGRLQREPFGVRNSVQQCGLGTRSTESRTSGQAGSYPARGRQLAQQFRRLEIAKSTRPQTSKEQQARAATTTTAVPSDDISAKQHGKSDAGLRTPAVAIDTHPTHGNFKIGRKPGCRRHVTVSFLMTALLAFV